MIREWLHRVTAPKEENPEVSPWYDCRWIEANYRCRIPLGDTENMPSGCDAACPVRYQMDQKAAELKKENQRMYT